MILMRFISIRNYLPEIGGEALISYSERIG